MDHTIALIQKSHEGDEEARAQIVEENTGLVWCIVRRFTEGEQSRRSVSDRKRLDYWKAIDKFDLSYEVKFSTYAVPMISGEIKRFLRDDGMIKVSRSLKELSYKGYQAQEVLGRKLGRSRRSQNLQSILMCHRKNLRWRWMHVRMWNHYTGRYTKKKDRRFH